MQRILSSRKILWVFNHKIIVLITIYNEPNSLGAAPDNFSTQIHVLIRKGIKERKIYFLTDWTRFVSINIGAVRIYIKDVTIKSSILESTGGRYQTGIPG
jgi:hypothetical protein